MNIWRADSEDNGLGVRREQGWLTYSRLLSTHDQVWVVLRHDSLSCLPSALPLGGWACLRVGRGVQVLRAPLRLLDLASPSLRMDATLWAGYR